MQGSFLIVIYNSQAMKIFTHYWLPFVLFLATTGFLDLWSGTHHYKNKESNPDTKSLKHYPMKKIEKMDNEDKSSFIPAHNNWVFFATT